MDKILFSAMCIFTLMDQSDCSSLSAVSMFLTDAEHHPVSVREVGIYADLRNINKHQIVHSRSKRDTETENPEILSLNVISNIMSRFGQTLIESEIENPYSENRDATFSIQIPETAFISNFTMLIDGQLMVAEVKPKAEADKLFEEAKNKNKTAGKVKKQVDSQKLARGMELFAVSVTIKAKSNVSFELYYMETLVRKLGKFEHRISIRPDQIVQSLSVKVLVHEKEGITVFDVFEPSLNSNSVSNKDTQIQHISDTTKEVLYQPSVSTQQTFSSEHHSISGDLVIVYDINHSHDIGSINIENGYFVHHFSPDENQMTILNKNIIFVIDISGSMSGKKIEQTRESMLTVLDWLHKGDQFMIILFDSDLEYWPPSYTFQQANSQNIHDAKTFVTENVHARGSTNINKALKDAALRYSEIPNNGGNIVVFLTDGRPSSGETDESKIVENVVSAASGKLAVYCIGFGYDLNYRLLKKISYRTGGDTVMIYEDKDAKEQLQEFYLQINNPLLFNLKFQYLPSTVIIVEDSITTTDFRNYFKGTEKTVAGKLQANAPSTWKARITADAGSQPFEMERDINVNLVYNIPKEITASKLYKPGIIERLYVYMKIKDLQKQELLFDDENTKEKIKQEAINLAIQFNLVTPYTSMIIVQKDRIDNTIEGQLHAAKRGFPGIIQYKGTVAYASSICNSFANFCYILFCTLLIHILT